MRESRVGGFLPAEFRVVGDFGGESGGQDFKGGVVQRRPVADQRRNKLRAYVDKIA